jgi:hypothetical protein
MWYTLARSTTGISCYCTFFWTWKSDRSLEDHQTIPVSRESTSGFGASRWSILNSRSAEEVLLQCHVTFHWLSKNTSTLNTDESLVGIDSAGISNILTTSWSYDLYDRNFRRFVIPRLPQDVAPYDPNLERLITNRRRCVKETNSERVISSSRRSITSLVL